MRRKKQEDYPVPPPELEGGEAEQAPPPAPEPAIPFDPSERLLNGRRAEALLSDPLLQAVFEAVGARYRAAWENAARGDLATQTTAHASLAALKDVVGTIRAHLGSAKLFEADLAAQKLRAQGKSPY
jgi:hypothetical protein